MFELPRSRSKQIGLVIAAIFYVGVGITHFSHADWFVAIMPPYLPAHLELVWLSGLLEILGGLGLFVKPTRRFASWGLVALLLAVFPANIHMAMHPELYIDLGATPTLLYARLPLQVVLVAWAYWVGT